MDYSKLRAAALKSTEDEEAVTVDTRALIDKVLARYSGEWTTLRELIQNAADAQATTVKIKWETLPSTSVPLPGTANRSDLLKHVLSNHTLRRLLVQNDGQPFTRTDWGRLKRIAEGNPDETKIGAFGVGFYSVFADCEEPFVSSGSEAMAFYWKGNSLFTRKMQLPEEQRTKDTAFVLDYRNTTTAVPNTLSICQFLATSLTFVALQHIEFWIDDWQILKLQKKTSPGASVGIPQDLDTRTKEGLMNLASVDRFSTQMDATAMSAVGWKPRASAAVSKEAYGFPSSDMPSLRSFFSKLTAGSSQTSSRTKDRRDERATMEVPSEDVTAISTTSIFLRVTSAVVETKVSASFASELERATKKPPPKTTKLSILTSSHDETLASESLSPDKGGSSRVPDVFSSILPSRKPGGRVFIGFPTAQTTGAGMHISAQSVIPTVEREAIDLNARWVRTWNMEMLRAAGIMIRLAYTNDMAELGSKFKRHVESSSKNAVPSPADVAKFVPEALHILKTYAFSDSTPSAHVGQIIEEAFWTAYKKPFIEVFSSRGVLPTTQVRLDSDELAKFVSGIPVVVNNMRENPFVKKLIDFGLIMGITFDDIRRELGAKALDKDQLAHFIRWAAKSARLKELDRESRQSLLDVAVATVGEDQGSIIALSAISTYLVPQKIPANFPLPPTTIPFAFTAEVPADDLLALGWTPLTILPWLKFLLEASGRAPEKEDMTKSEVLAAQVLAVLSKAWNEVTVAAQAEVVSLLEHRTVIPTKLGLRKPKESYFPSVKLFDDLAIVKSCFGVKDKFLATLGVRKTVELDTIFARLLTESPGGSPSGQPRWSHMELIKYLSSVQGDIPSDDMKKLRETRFCPAEAGPKGMEPTKASERLYRVNELFEPKDALRVLALPVLQWPGPPGSFRPGSKEANFLWLLGLRPHPSVPELLDMMASEDATRREIARLYFISTHHLNGYASFNLSGTTKAILPLEGDNKLAPPSTCFTNEKAALLGFSVLRKDFHPHANKFGVASDPPIMECVLRLIANPPQTRQSAVPLFEYFSTRLNALDANTLARLRDAPIVPVVRRGQGVAEGSRPSGLTYVRPPQCYLGSSSTYEDIFDFVDFGPSANAFLFRCGSRSEPVKTEIAWLVCREPARLLSTLQTTERYLGLLRTLADSITELKRDKALIRAMRTSAFLLGWQEISRQGPNPTDFDNEEPTIKKYQLAAPKDIVVLDDFISYRLFRTSLLCAPEEETLEQFYLSMGVPTLSDIVDEDVKIGPHSDNPSSASSLRKHIIERSKIFLYEYQRHSRDGVRHDARWLDQNLSVEMVRSVALRRSLQGKGQSHQEKRSAASVPARAGHVLYVSTETKVDMYQVGQALCMLLLKRPNPQAYFFFEPFLKLELLDLKARGYNIDRILRAKAAEARIAEEERRRALEKEESAIRDREREWATKAQGVSATAKQDPTPPKMPGAFSDDPDSPEGPGPSRHPSPPSWKGKGLFSQLTRRLGIDHHRHDEQQDPSSTQDSGDDTEKSTTEKESSGAGKSRQKDDGRVTAPAAIQQNLLNAIKSTRAHGSSTLFAPPTTKEVKERATYCDSTSAHNLNFVAEAPRGMQIFLEKDVSVEPSEFLAAQTGAIGAFESLLADVNAVYGVSKTATHIYYDEAGSTIAFNQNGSIFCNLRFFLQLHAAQLRDANAGDAKAEATVWWWVVMAHELAHNLEKSHSAAHSFYTESFIQEYFAKMMAKVAQYQAHQASSAVTGLAVDHSAAAASASRGSASGAQQQANWPLAPPPPYHEAMVERRESRSGR